HAIPRGSARSVSPAPYFAPRAAIRVVRAIRSNQTWKRPVPGRPPRREFRRRQAQGPAGKLLWEEAFAGEVSCGALEDLVFHLKLAVLAAKLGQLLFLGTGELYLAALFVGVGLGHPVPEARLADAEVLGELADGFGPFAGELDGAAAELRGVGCG